MLHTETGWFFICRAERTLRKKDDSLVLNLGHVPLDLRGDSSGFIEGEPIFPVDRKPCTSLGTNLAMWALESLLWLVSLLLAAQAGTGIERKTLLRFPNSNALEVRDSTPCRHKKPNLQRKTSTGYNGSLSLEEDDARRKPQAAYGRLPLRFEPNYGQAEGSVQFLSHDGSHSVLLKSSEVILELPLVTSGSSWPQDGGRTSASSPTKFSTLRIRLHGGNARSEA